MNRKKVFAVLGSPHTEGITSAMLDYAVCSAEKAGYEVTKVNLFDRLLGIAMEETSTFPKPRLSGKRYMLLTACNTPAPFSWIFGQSRGAIRNMDEFFKTAGMKCMGKFVCTNTSKIMTVPESLVRKIERGWR